MAMIGSERPNCPVCARGMKLTRILQQEDATQTLRVFGCDPCGVVYTTGTVRRGKSETSDSARP